MTFQQAAQGPFVIRLEGVFDGGAARRLESLLADASPDARVAIDLTQVREFHDYGIAVLGHALLESPAKVTVRGLRHHHVRVLRYFGVDAGALEAAVAPGT